MQDKRIDEYIENSNLFAKPILTHIRKLVHQACPEVEESMKWSFPHFSYQGILCSMAAFKEHCALTFWKGSLMTDTQQVMDKTRENSMGQFGPLTSTNDLPADNILIEYIQEAMRLNEEGIKVPKKISKEPKKLEIPEFFMDAVKKNKKALECFDNFPYSKKKEYVEWVIAAKQEATREKRLATTVEWLSEGKSKNWKYENC